MVSAAVQTLSAREHEAPGAEGRAAEDNEVEARRRHLAELLRATGEGDRDAFAELYQDTAAKLYGFARRIVKDEGRAQECLQDAFIRIWEHAGDYRPERGAPLTWMGIIVRRRALDMVRRGDRERILSDPDEVDRRADRDRPSLGPEATSDPHAGERLSACLGKLRHEQAEAVRLAYFEGLAHPEVAERMGTPLGTIKTWIRRGMEKLRACMEA